MRTLFVAALVAAACGCTQNEDLSDEAFVSGLRVLGAEADPPEAAAGDTVQLTAWAVDTMGRAVDVEWSACMLPSNGLANPACTDGSGNGLVALGSGLTITMTMPDVDASLLGPPDATLGVYLPIVIHAVAGKDTVDAVYRLRARVPELLAAGCTLEAPYGPPQGHCDPNKNPTIDHIDPLLPPDQDPTPTTKDEIWALYLQYTQDSAEEYGNPQSVFERLTTQWFATAGSFPNAPVGGTGVQKFTLDRALPPSGGTIDLWAVGHDERGGTTMTHRTFVMQ